MVGVAYAMRIDDVELIVPYHGTHNAVAAPTDVQVLEGNILAEGFAVRDGTVDLLVQVWESEVALLFAETIIFAIAGVVEAPLALICLVGMLFRFWMRMFALVALAVFVGDNRMRGRRARVFEGVYAVLSKRRKSLSCKQNEGKQYGEGDAGVKCYRPHS